MAHHETLDIYLPAYELTLLATRYVGRFPRDIKGPLGSMLLERCFDQLMLVRDANIANDKVPHLAELLTCNARLGVMFRACKDLKLISRDQYSEAVKLTTSVGRQASGWKRANA